MKLVSGTRRWDIWRVFGGCAYSAFAFCYMWRVINLQSLDD